MARLLYNDRAGLQQVLELDPDRQQFVLGRQSDCDIIVHDTSVSRRHCIIVPEVAGFAVVDLGSANGTLVNDVRVTRRRLTDGDVIRCGIYAVRFSDEAARVEQAQVTLRDRYRRRSAETSLRASVERLQAINESQAERLVQLQDAFGRVETERDGARRQVVEMQQHLRQLAAAVQHLERENARLRSSSAAATSAPPPIPPPPVEPVGLARVDLAAENQALRAAIAQLEGSLAAAGTFVKAAQLVPAVDRWQLASAARAMPTRASTGATDLPDAKVAAAEARVAALQTERATLRTALAQARHGLSEAEARIESMRGLAARPVSPFGLPAQGVGLGSGATLGKGVARTGPLLSALGGLGRTAGTARPVQDEAGEQNRSDVDEQRRARRAAERLCERLSAFRSETGATGATAEDLVEIALLAGAVRDALA